MLGKTNITTLSEGGIVTEIEDFSWIRMESGTYADIEKAVFENGYLAALTADGSVLFTKDGEYWELLKLDYIDCRLNDIAWDGKRFLLVGSCTDNSVNEDDTIGLMLATDDFKSVEKLSFFEYASGQYFAEYFVAFPQNGKCVLVAREGKLLYLLTVDLTVGGVDCQQISIEIAYLREYLRISAAKNADTILIYILAETLINGNTGYAQVAAKISDGKLSMLNLTFPRSSEIAATVFECKLALYVQVLIATNSKYPLYKITDSGEIMTVCTEQNYMLKDGVYYNECQLFINSHSLLIVRKKENLADKTVDALIEVAPEDTMTCITKAFGQLYIFGKRGLILKSSVEAKNENSILVQTLSAKKALEEAKAYADAKCKELEERISGLESQHDNS